MTTLWPPAPIRGDAKSAPFFAAAAQGQLMIKQCAACATHLPPEATVCTTCGDPEPGWVRSRGVASLVTWTVVHRAPNAAYAGLVPYVVGIVELAEGPWLYARIDTTAPVAGMTLRAVFLPSEGGESHPIFHAGE